MINIIKKKLFLALRQNILGIKILICIQFCLEYHNFIKF